MPTYMMYELKADFCQREIDRLIDKYGNDNSCIQDELETLAQRKELYEYKAMKARGGR